MIIEKKMNIFPYFINKEIEEKCPECGQLHKKLYKYELKFVISPVEGEYRYKLFYYCINSYKNDEYKYIGTHTGFGFKTIQEAIDDLKGYM